MLDIYIDADYEEGEVYRKFVLLVFVSVLLFSAVLGTGVVERGVDVADPGESGQRVLSGLGSDGVSATSWPMFHHDLRHTGYSTSKAPKTNNVLWSYTTGYLVLSSPAVADGMVFVGSDDQKVYALNETTGALIWSYTTGNYVTSSPAVADGMVFVGSHVKKVYALNETTGALIWSYTTGYSVESCPAVADGMVFVGSRDNKVYCFGPGRPTADTNGPYQGYEGSPITFDASSSTDDGTIVQYEWDWNNDATYDENTTSPSINHTWTDDYAGTVGLRVTDNDGLTDTDTASVTVQNVAPTVNAGPDQTADEGSGVSFSGSFTDPGAVDTHTLFWDFGDGTNATGTLTPAHAYGDNGIYTVILKVTDDDAGLGTDTLQVTANNVPPTVEAGPNQTVNVGWVASFSGNFTDPGWLDTHTIFWDFGDGTNTTGTLTPAHAYGNTGNYTVTLKVTDDDGGVGTDTLEITVKTPTPPVGGIWTTPNKLELLAPWIALTTTIISAIAITAIFLKHKKGKQ